MDSDVVDDSGRQRMTVAELREMLGGIVRGHVDEGVTIAGTCGIDSYVENRVSFIRSRKYAGWLAGLDRAVLLIPERLVDLCEEYPQNTYVVVRDAARAMIDVQEFFYAHQRVVSEEGVARTACLEAGVVVGRLGFVGEFVFIGRNTVIGEGTKVMHGCYLSEDVTIGRDTLLYPHVYVHRGCQIGDNCVIYPGARIGTEGFRLEQDVSNRSVRRMHHAGRVTIGDRVEVGANTAIDRATFENDATVIGDDARVDNLVHIAHNAKVGARAIIVAQSCVGGSATIGEDAWIGIGAAISNGVNIGARARVLLNAVVAHDVAADEIVSGFYAMPHRQWKRVYERLKGM